MTFPFMDPKFLRQLQIAAENAQAIQKSFAPVQNMLKQLDPIRKMIRQLEMSGVHQMYRNLESSGVFEAIERARPFHEHLLRARSRNEQEKMMFGHLAVMGWYLNPDSTDETIAELVQLFQKNDSAGINDLMTGIVTAQATEISQDAKLLRPEHGAIFDVAIDAHVTGNYVVSVLLFLQQADGLTLDLLDTSLFKRRHRDSDPSTANEQKILDLKDDEDAFLEVMNIALIPLLEGTALQRNFDELDEDLADDSQKHVSRMARHSVMHGKDANYGTQINSCQALAALGYMTWIHRQLDEEE